MERVADRADGEVGADGGARETALVDRIRIELVRRPVDSRLHAYPVLDGDDLLWRGDAWVALSPIEAAILQAFLEAPGVVLGRRVLAAAGWPDGAPAHRAVDTYVTRLRRRVAGLGLQLRTVRSRGYLLEIDGVQQQMVAVGAHAGP